VADYQLPFGKTERFTLTESWQGSPAPTLLPANWTTNNAAALTLAPVGGSNPSTACDVTPVAGVAPQAGIQLYAGIPNGPSGTLVIDTVLQVDTVVITPT
jgi:hypothetical protein